jgi:Trp operon repressor
MCVLSKPEDEKRCLGIFKLLLKVGEEEDINRVLKIVEHLLEECQNSSL